MDEGRTDACEVVLSGAITRDEIPALCTHLARELDERAPVDVRCDVGALSQPDVVVLELLARLQLIARRRACRLVLLDAHGDLLRLVALAGLGDALPGAVSVRQVRREPEGGEECGVEEVGDPADPTG